MLGALGLAPGVPADASLPARSPTMVLKARIMKWFAISFSSGPHFVRTLHHDLSVLGGPTGHGLVSLS